MALARKGVKKRVPEDVVERAGRIVAEHALGVASLEGWERLTSEEQEMCREIARDVCAALLAAGLGAVPPIPRPVAVRPKASKDLEPPPFLFVSDIKRDDQ